MTQPAAARVRAALEAHGVASEVIELAESARTAAQAASACGVAVGQIVKSLVFLSGDEPILVLVSGANQATRRSILPIRSERCASAAFPRSGIRRHSACSSTGTSSATSA